MEMFYFILKCLAIIQTSSQDRMAFEASMSHCICFLWALLVWCPQVTMIKLKYNIKGGSGVMVSTSAHIHVLIALQKIWKIHVASTRNTVIDTLSRVAG